MKQIAKILTVAVAALATSPALAACDFLANDDYRIDFFSKQPTLNGKSCSVSYGANTYYGECAGYPKGFVYLDHFGGRVDPADKKPGAWFVIESKDYKKRVYEDCGGASS